MRILAIDTSTLTGSIALVEDSRVRAETALYLQGAHSAVIPEAIRLLLAQCDVRVDAVDVFAAGLGPGSFTGVRIGVAIVKGFGLATGKPVHGKGSLDILAAQALGAQGPVVAAIDARRNEVFYALYEPGPDGGRTRLVDPEHREPLAAGQHIAELLGDRPGAVVIGDLDAVMRARVREGAGAKQLEFVPQVMGTPLARMLAHEVLAGRTLVDDGTMEPHYVRPTDAKLPARALAVPKP